MLEQLKAGRLTGIKRLDLSCGLTEFPREIFDLADSLEILNLSGNQLSSLPDDLPRLYKLRIIFCSDNLFTELPTVLGRCENLTMVGFKANQISRVPAEALAPTLRWLILTDNRIQSLPSSIGKCTQMQKLMLAGNELNDLPAELASCEQLELLRLSANRFSTLPAWLLKMPRLAWLALAGNPLTDAFEAARQAPSIAEIDWQDIDLGIKLGEGASGVIYQAKQRQTDESFTEVAVKLFKSAVTSDGMPRSEMAASIAVGLHPHVVGVLGKISHHPNETRGLNMGLVMPLISSDFINLAQPPSLESCTRDVYLQGLTFRLQELYSLALGIARAAEHLHACGILHGDLYAHNILHNSEGQGLLGDFGAASSLSIQDHDTSHALQRIEVRAFGILLGELMSLCSESDDDAEQAIKSKFTALQRHCMQTDVSARPLFADVVCALNLHMDVASSAS
ncbi:MAG: leucine-rich repeat-containing protein kinase family protein [Burkholderiaceae bacterium]